MVQIGGIRHHDQVAVVQFVAHVHLPGDARENLRQGLVQRIQGDDPLNAGVDVQVDFCIARQGKQNLLYRDIGDDDAVGFCLGHRFGRRENDAAFYGLRNAGCSRGRAGWLLDMLIRWLNGFGAATGKNCADGTETYSVA